MQKEINNNFSKEDEFYMKRAIELAKNGTGWVNPNPLVGAVIVKDDRIIGEGWHRKYGELHAERDALSRCMEDTSGATIYVTLEPCCHHGKQPPCTEALVQAGISRVVIGSMDPNPLVSGKGVKYLEEHGIKVEGCVCNEECLAMNYVFFHYIRNKEPYVVMKTAQTLDGKIATYKGLSKWITGEQARENVHADRHRYAAIMVGVGTVIADNPMLDCRSTAISNPHNPVRIICDSRLRIPLDSRIVKSAGQIPTIIATCSTDSDRKSLYENAGCEVVVTKEYDEHVDLKELMHILGEKGIDSIILEGGGTLNFSALQAGIVNRVQTYIAPKIFGGADSKTAVEGQGVANVDEAYQLRNKTVRLLGDDILIEGEL